MTPIPLLGCRIHKATDGKIGWSLTAWEVGRRERRASVRENAPNGGGPGGLEIEPVEHAELAREEGR